MHNISSIFNLYIVTLGSRKPGALEAFFRIFNPEISIDSVAPLFSISPFLPSSPHGCWERLVCARANGRKQSDRMGGSSGRLSFSAKLLSVVQSVLKSDHLVASCNSSIHKGRGLFIGEMLMKSHPTSGFDG